ncbi:MAG: efflux RND transporter periplasmic adaptor subunit [Wenzhouxiangella sp.]|jgi:membrane fusion protein (multidrug efflux system)|nr:efflux RND transporter periplasmic adaptor subunit [Wenzhouxiangella sp.]
MNRLMILIAAVSLTILTACDQAPESDESLAEDAEIVEQIPVEVALAELGSVSAFYSATASLEADGRAKVVPRIGGQVMELLVEEGDSVKAGQVLARLDADRLRLQLAQAEANMRRLAQDFDRHREMHERDMISTETFDRLKFEFEAQSAQYKLAQLEVSYSEITAPIDGVISMRQVRVGNQVNTVDPVFEVTALDPLQAVLDVPERELSRLQPGQTAILRADALPGEEFVGEVARISPVIDPDSGTFRVTVELGGEHKRLRPGMFGRFSIIYDQRDEVVLVPVEAVLSEDGRSSVFVIRDGQAERRAVMPGYRNNGHFEITEGLEAGEQVVTTGQASLRTGSTVLVLNQPVDYDSTSSLVSTDASAGDDA